MATVEELAYKITEESLRRILTDSQLYPLAKKIEELDERDLHQFKNHIWFSVRDHLSKR